MVKSKDMFLFEANLIIDDFVKMGIDIYEFARVAQLVRAPHS